MNAQNANYIKLNQFLGTIPSAISSLANVGPALGEIGTFGNYGAEPAVAKVIYCLDMFLGRVEIYPVLAACGMIFSRAKR